MLPKLRNRQKRKELLLKKLCRCCNYLTPIRENRLVLRAIKKEIFGFCKLMCFDMNDFVEIFFSMLRFEFQFLRAMCRIGVHF